MEGVGAGFRDHGDLAAGGAPVFGGEEHGVDTKFLDGVDRDGEANEGLLGLIDDVGGVDAVVGKVIVVEAAAGEADAALVAAAGIDSAGNQRCEGGPVSAVQRQVSGLPRLDASAERGGGLIHLRGLGGDIHLLGDARDLESDVEGPCVPHGLLKSIDGDRLKAAGRRRDAIEPDGQLRNVIGAV